MRIRANDFGSASTLVVAVVGSLLIIAAAGLGIRYRQGYFGQSRAASRASIQTSRQPAVVSSRHASPPSAATPCTDATDKEVVVSISKRHLWVCNGSQAAYDAAVVTGMETQPADLTPTGTYHISGKYTDQVLKGSDRTGSWSDRVQYWLPFLTNKYGTYGFHDATWRQPKEFGNTSPYSDKASHGCVELPLAAAKWLYGWAAVGTTVVVQS